MKKIGLLLLFMGALCGSMGAQNDFQLTRHAESKKIDFPLLEKGIYVGQYEGLYCWIGDGRRHRKHVVLADHNLEPLRRMELPESAVNYRILTASMHDNHATVLLVDEPDNRHTLVYKAVVDLDSMRPAEGTQPLTVVDSFSYDRKDHCLVWAATSPNGTYTALITIVDERLCDGVDGPTGGDRRRNHGDVGPRTGLPRDAHHIQRDEREARRQL